MVKKKDWTAIIGHKGKAGKGGNIFHHKGIRGETITFTRSIVLFGKAISWKRTLFRQLFLFGRTELERGKN